MVLVDANVLLDILTADLIWSAWSREGLMRAADQGLAINPIVYAELCPAFRMEEELSAALAGWPLEYLPLPYEAAWLTAQAFAAYRQRGGVRTSPCRIFICAHMHRFRV
jgi:hypothetical protein